MSDSEDDDGGFCERMPPSFLAISPEMSWKEKKFPSRELRIFGDICDKLAQSFEKEIRKFQRDNVKEFVISIDSSGGCVFACMRMVSLIESLDAHITTVCRGKAESAASILFACGQRRVMGPRSKLMIHNIHTSTKSQETLQETRLDLEETERINRDFCDVYANASNKSSRWFNKNIMERNVDIVLTPEDAKEMGLATDIGYVDIEIEAVLKTHVHVRPSKISRKRKR